MDVRGIKVPKATGDIGAYRDMSLLDGDISDPYDPVDDEVEAEIGA